ncbi:hypothetical protein SDC9_153402 [bioreactor metagenome]|uniref:Uncharacterized protein n=1 Tax=bioreactor metagenome TaxID=1076179 RepID=A0A645EXK1_9ZZZZ
MPVDLYQPSGECIRLQTQPLGAHLASIRMQSQVQLLEETTLTIEVET